MLPTIPKVDVEIRIDRQFAGSHPNIVQAVRELEKMKYGVGIKLTVLTML